MNEEDLPPINPTAEQENFDQRIQELTQNIQEQAFLLGYRNGFREGDMVQGLLQWARERSMEADSSEERTAWMEVERHLASNGAFIQDDEITHPPGLNCYIGAADSRPHIQVGGERLPVEDFEFRWEPAAEAAASADSGFEPRGGTGEITIQAELELPEETEHREALMQFLQGLR